MNRYGFKAEFKVTRPLRRSPSHPGALMPVAEAAQRMQVSRQSLYSVLNCQSAVTAEMALRFGKRKLTGGEPSLYIQMQGRHNLWLAEQRLGRALRAVEAAR